MIKPDAVRRKLVGEIVSRIEADSFTIRDACFLRLTGDRAQEFYQIHKGKGFYDGLVEFMTSGPIMALLLERPGAVARLREIAGATDPTQAKPGTIRADFGTSIRENVVHAPNPDENPEQEIRFFFPSTKR